MFLFSLSAAALPHDSAVRPHRPDVPWGVFKRQQARISRHRLYPMTAFYTVYCTAVFILALFSKHPLIAIGFYLAGIPLWTFVEYLFHRFVLHGHFADGEGWIRKFAHRRLDPLHWEHHERPWDGMHINGELKDLLVLFFVFAPLSFIGPIWSLPVLYAGVVQSYVAEEWIHHSVHFYNFRSPYFRYIKAHHLFHHSPKGEKMGYGLTNGFWDIICNTRYPHGIRNSLYHHKQAAVKQALSSNARHA